MKQLTPRRRIVPRVDKTKNLIIHITKIEGYPCLVSTIQNDFHLKNKNSMQINSKDPNAKYLLSLNELHNTPII